MSSTRFSHGPGAAAAVSAASAFGNCSESIAPVKPRPSPPARSFGGPLAFLAAPACILVVSALLHSQSNGGGHLGPKLSAVTPPLETPARALPRPPHTVGSPPELPPAPADWPVTAAGPAAKEQAPAVLARWREQLDQCLRHMPGPGSNRMRRLSFRHRLPSGCEVPAVAISILFMVAFVLNTANLSWVASGIGATASGLVVMYALDQIFAKKY
eukprot:GHVT01099181.1.p1 GENE.GHVT01099181.1~~GHVT01099181.1.p1  ORF type:complete len:214 (-),score=41.03 GHVT01099181.1:719-1360(-)